MVAAPEGFCEDATSSREPRKGLLNGNFTKDCVACPLGRRVVRKSFRRSLGRHAPPSSRSYWKRLSVRRTIRYWRTLALRPDAVIHPLPCATDQREDGGRTTIQPYRPNGSSWCRKTAISRHRSSSPRASQPTTMQSNWYTRDLNIRRAAWISWALTNTASHGADRVSLPYGCLLINVALLLGPRSVDTSGPACGRGGFGGPERASVSSGSDMAGASGSSARS